jgi:hypothetical protein
MSTPRRHQPAPRTPANNNQPLLTIERAIADVLTPASLRQVAEANINCGARRERQARNLLAVAERLELLGYRSAA